VFFFVAGHDTRPDELAAGLDDVVQPLWSYWALDGRTFERDETRKAYVQLRRYRAALRKFARDETAPAAGAHVLSVGS